MESSNSPSSSNVDLKKDGKQELIVDEKSNDNKKSNENKNVDDNNNKNNENNNSNIKDSKREIGDEIKDSYTFKGEDGEEYFYERMKKEHLSKVFIIGYAFYGEHFRSRLSSLRQELFESGCWIVKKRKNSDENNNNDNNTNNSNANNNNNNNNDKKDELKKKKNENNDNNNDNFDDSWQDKFSVKIEDYENAISDEADSEFEVIGYMISSPDHLGGLPMEENFVSQNLSKEQLKSMVYVIHDVVIQKHYRSKGVHKLFHKLSVKHCKASKCTKIYAVALTTSFRKPNKLYRFQDVCKALWSGPEAFVVVRDLSLE